PEQFAARMVDRVKKPLGDLFSLTNFGINLTRLAPSALSALRHAHALQDEFIYVLEGSPILITNSGETQLHSGVCAGFKAGTGDAHQLINRSDADVVYLEVGDRTAGDTVTYPDDDLKAQMVNGNWLFSHKDGTSY
ncbi:MAG: cupin domain-containing protein, partial [Candidatus Nitrotoga sp.]